MLSFLAASASNKNAEVRDLAALGLVDAMRYDVHKADAYVADLDHSIPGILDNIHRMAQDCNVTAMLILAEWGEPDSAVIAAARAGEAGILAEPVGSVRTDFAIGDATERAACL